MESSWLSPWELYSGCAVTLLNNSRMLNPNQTGISGAKRQPASQRAKDPFNDEFPKADNRPLWC